MKLFNQWLKRPSIETHSDMPAWPSIQRQVARRLQMLLGDWEDQLRDWVKPRVQAKAWQTIYRDRYVWSTETNVMADIVERSARVYSRPPLRQLPAADREPSWFPEPTFNALWQQVNRLVLVSGLVLVRPILQADRSWRFQVLTPDRFEPGTDPADPSRLIGVTLRSRRGETLTIRLGDGSAPFMSQESEASSRTWRGEAYPFRDESGTPFLPFAVVRWQCPPDQLFNPFVGADLADATLKVGWLDTQKEWLIRGQSHKQFVLAGPAASRVPDAIIDPSTPIVLDQADGNEMRLELLDLQTDPSHIDRAVDVIMERLAARRGLTLGDFRVQSQPESGVALRIRNQRRAEALAEQQQMFRAAEGDLFCIMRAIWNRVHKAEPIDSAARLDIRFANPWPDELDDLDDLLKLVLLGALSWPAFVRKVSGGSLSDDDIPQEPDPAWLAATLGLRIPSESAPTSHAGAAS